MVVKLYGSHTQNKMIKLKKTLLAFKTSDFKNIVKTEITNIDKAQLPLQQGLSLSSYVGQAPFSVVILNVVENESSLNIKTGIFYTGIIAGCSCSDDPSPTDEQTEYCELQFDINKNTAVTTVILLNS